MAWSIRIGREMGARVEGYRADLRALQDWEPYLKLSLIHI